MPKLRALTLTVALLIGSIGCFLVSSVVAKAFLRLQDNFGAGDLRAFSIFSVVFALVLLLPAGLFAVVLRRVRLINRLWLAILLGALAGFCWTVLNRWYLGPWFGAWSFPVLYCWVAGGVFGLLAVAVLSREKNIAQ
jgi:hypothetical protein